MGEGIGMFPMSAGRRNCTALKVQGNLAVARKIFMVASLVSGPHRSWGRYGVGTSANEMFCGALTML